MIDKLTWTFVIGIWALWLVWEMVLLALRGTGTYVKTISMVARDSAFRLNSVCYAWGGMATHWFWPGSEWATVAGSIIFWVLCAALLVQDILLWKTPRETLHPVVRWLRFPMVPVIVGAVAGKLLFPQGF